MICPNCKKNTPEGKFCEHCGARIDEPAHTAPAPPGKPGGTSSPVSRTLLIGVALVIVICAVIAVVVFLPQAGQKSGTSERAVQYYNEGMQYAAAGKYSEAVASFDQAITLDPSYIEAWNGRGLALYNRGMYNEAVISFDRVLLSRPQDSLATEYRKLALEKLATTPITVISTAIPRPELELVGNFYGTSTNTAQGINRLQFTITPAIGSGPVDVAGMKLFFTTADRGLVILSNGPAATTSTFTATAADGAPLATITSADQAIITFGVDPLPPNTRFDLEIRPPGGTAAHVARTTPASIAATNILY
ncbi:MAG: tetratricopeptide repeat protein [Methanomicrobiales archaeon]|nr:tetratricopeptide repeat protein [Methanomicrobiales archaeon]